MTDLETIKAMLARAEIGYAIILHGEERGVHLAIERGGYIGFHTLLSFDADGNMTDVRAIASD